MKIIIYIRVKLCKIPKAKQYEIFCLHDVTYGGIKLGMDKVKFTNMERRICPNKIDLRFRKI